MSSEVDVSELVNFVLRDSTMHVNIAIGIAYVSGEVPRFFLK